MTEEVADERNGLNKKKNHSASALSTSAILLLVVANLLWGASSAAAKVGLSECGPFTLAVLRFFPAGLLLFFIAKAQGTWPRKFQKEDRVNLFLLGFLAITLTYGIFYNGMQSASATDGSLLFACEPLLISLFAVLFLRERLAASQWLGLCLGLFGVWMIAGQATANLVALLGISIETTTSVIGKRLSAKYPGLTLAAFEMLLGSSLLVPFAIWESLHHPPHFTINGVLCLVYLSGVCSAFGFGLWYWLLNRFPISAMSAFILIQPMTGPFYGWLFRHESLTKSSAFGGGMIVLALFLTVLTRRKTAK